MCTVLLQLQHAVCGAIAFCICQLMCFAQDEQTQVCGVVIVENMADVGLVHARNIDRAAMKLWLSYLQVTVR